MADTRSKLDKLRAMAAQSESPREAEIARRILAEMVEEPKDLDQAMRDLGSTFERMGFASEEVSRVWSDLGFTVEESFGRKVATWTGDLRTKNAPLREMARAVQERDPERISSAPIPLGPGET